MIDVGNEGATRERDADSPLADPSTRVAAYLIDLACALAWTGLFVFALLGSSSRLVFLASLLGVTLLGLAGMSIEVLWLRRYGQTVGMRCMRLRMTRSDGTRAGLGRILALRYALPTGISLIPFAGWAFSLADPFFVFSRTRQCLHDHFADTIVIDLRAPKP